MDGQTGAAITARNKKALKTLKMLLILYTICVVPGSFYGLLYPILGHFIPTFYEFSWTEAGYIAYFCHQYGICINNMANVFIYVGRISEFRKFLAKPLQMCCRTNHPTFVEPKPKRQQVAITSF
eukprot:TCONS_00068333-protein